MLEWGGVYMADMTGPTAIMFHRKIWNPVVLALLIISLRHPCLLHGRRSPPVCTDNHYDKLYKETS